NPPSAEETTLNRNGPLEPTASYQGRMTDGRATGIAGVVIDLFASQADGSRGPFLFNVVSSADGGFQADLLPGCYVTVAIAPNDTYFFETGGDYGREAFCVTAGETVDARVLSIIPDGSVGTFTGVAEDLEGDMILTINVYATDSDVWTRGALMNSVEISASPQYAVIYSFDVPARCYIVEFVPPAGTRFIDGSPSLETFTCVSRGSRRELDDTNLIPGDAIVLGFDTATGIAHVPATDRIVVTGDDEAQIWSTDGELVATIEGIPGARLPTATDDTRVVVSSSGSDELVVVDTANNSIVRRLDPQATNITSIDVVGDVIWYHERDTGVGRASLTTGAVAPRFYEFREGSAVIAVSPAIPDRVYSVAFSHTPQNLNWWGPNDTRRFSPDHDDYYPFAAADDGEIWAVHEDAIARFDPDSLSRTGSAIPIAQGVNARRLIVDTTAIHLGTPDGFLSYDRQTLQPTATSSYVGLALTTHDANAETRVAIGFHKTRPFPDLQYLVIDR
ncbi:MAG: hypothetical protein AAFO29_12650, partial [Actinomycetota bacterium]